MRCFLHMLTHPHFGYYKMAVDEYVPEIWFQNAPSSQTHYNNDGLIAILLDTMPKYYSEFLKMYGAIGPKNGKTYFTSENNCCAFLEILEYLYTEIKENGQSWLTMMYKLLNNTVSTSKINEKDVRVDYYSSNAKTYINQQRRQGTPKDINYTKKEAKEMNTGNINYNPFNPNRTKKPTHYVFLNNNN